MRIGILGAGPVGTRLGQLLSDAGHDVEHGGRGRFDAIVRHAEVLVIAVPFDVCASALPPLASAIRDKVVIDATNPVGGNWSPMMIGEQNSAGEEIARLLPNARVAKAFNTIFADIMTKEGLDRDGFSVTCFIASDHVEARKVAATIANDAGFDPVDAGELKSSRYLEAMAHLNIAMALSAGGTDCAFIYHRRRAA